MFSQIKVFPQIKILSQFKVLRRMKTLAAKALTLALLAGASSFQFGSCTETINAQHDWTLELESQELKQKAYESSNTGKKICRINVYVYENGVENSSPLLIQQIWYLSGESKARGMRKLASLPIPEGKSVEFKLKYKGNPPDQLASDGLADATLRLLLDLSLNRDSVPIVRVPDELAQSALSSLANKHFVQMDAQADQINNQALTLAVQAGAGSSPVRLVFNP